MRLAYDTGVDSATERSELLAINPRVFIPQADIDFRFARSSGPGGQHTNKAETSVELRFDLVHTPYLGEEERTLALQRLGPYLDSEGFLHLVSQSERSQLRNREEVTERFVQLLRRALVPQKRRHPTRPSRAARERRLTQKRKSAKIKNERRRPTVDEP